ncbi:MAG: ribbon-helix-helix protein, CopG family [Chlamydiae bacterium]|nr:ribbon-helix-helix protein, CopG family [Chlamydiota bacterium]MBI3266065.1 ribbon-helix-helix protein, CopG family [Chlamydiota bacterium]
MQRTIKIAISLPREDFERIEKLRKRAKVERSTVIDRAIRFALALE